MGCLGLGELNLGANPGLYGVVKPSSAEPPRNSPGGESQRNHDSDNCNPALGAPKAQDQQDQAHEQSKDHPASAHGRRPRIAVQIMPMPTPPRTRPTRISRLTT